MHKYNKFLTNNTPIFFKCQLVYNFSEITIIFLSISMDLSQLIVLQAWGPSIKSRFTKLRSLGTSKF